MITLDEIAARAGVSRTAVSFALSAGPNTRKVAAKTREHIMRIADELNYVPDLAARALRSRRTAIVGVVFPDLLSDWSHRLLTSMMGTLESWQYTPLVSLDLWDPARQRKELLSLAARRVEGIIVTTPHGRNTDVYRDVQRRGTPILFLGDALPDPADEFSHICWDEGMAVKMALDHLVETGRRHIACVYAQPSSPFSPTLMHTARMEALRRGLVAAGLAFRGDWMLGIKAGSSPADAVRAVFSDATRKPDALLGTNDVLARLSGDMLKRMGFQIPSEVAVMGLGNHMLSGHYCMSLSSVHQPLNQIGRLAAETMLKLASGPTRSPIRRTISGMRLVVRGSTVSGRHEAWADGSA